MEKTLQNMLECGLNDYGAYFEALLCDKDIEILEQYEDSDEVPIEVWELIQEEIMSSDMTDDENIAWQCGYVRAIQNVIQALGKGGRRAGK